MERCNEFLILVEKGSPVHSTRHMARVQWAARSDAGSLVSGSTDVVTGAEL